MIARALHTKTIPGQLEHAVIVSIEGNPLALFGSLLILVKSSVSVGYRVYCSLFSLLSSC